MSNPKPLMYQYQDIGKMIFEYKILIEDSKNETKRLEEILAELRYLRGELASKIFNEVFNHA